MFFTLFGSKIKYGSQDVFGYPILCEVFMFSFTYPLPLADNRVLPQRCAENVVSPVLQVKTSTPGRSRRSENTEKSLLGNSGQQKAKRCFTRNR